MAQRFSRNEVLTRLRAQIDAGTSLLVTGAGNGLMARCAESAGADLIVAYNSSYFRLNGHQSMLGNLPIGNANDIMLDMGKRNLLPIIKNTPLIGGVYGLDPTRALEDVFGDMQDRGFSGTINFPTVGRIDGQYRKDLEAAGLGFEREVEMTRRAREAGLFSMCYVYSGEDAARMAEAGVDVVVGHCGLTAGGDVGSTNAMPLDRAVESLKGIFDSAKSARADVILLSHGGPITTPEDAEYVNLHTDAVGFVAASSVERIPVEASVKEACRSLKAIRVTA